MNEFSPLFAVYHLQEDMYGELVPKLASRGKGVAVFDTYESAYRSYSQNKRLAIEDTFFIVEYNAEGVRVIENTTDL